VTPFWPRGPDLSLHLIALLAAATLGGPVGAGMAQEHQEYIQQKVNPILENLVTQLLLERPESLAPFMIKWLSEHAKTPAAAALTDGVNELGSMKAELEKLQEEVKQLEAEVGQKPSAGDSPKKKDEESEEEEEDDEEVDVGPPPEAYLKKERTSVSAEAYGKWNVPKKFTPPDYPKTDEQKSRIKSVLKESFLFSSLEPKDFDIIVGAMQEKVCDPGTRIIEQGDDGDCLFVVEEGQMNCYKKTAKEAIAAELDPQKVKDLKKLARDQGVTEQEIEDSDEAEQPKKALIKLIVDKTPPKENLVKECKAGDAFGELALMYNCPRAASVVAHEKCVLWQLDRETFNHIVRDAASKRRQRYEDFLKTVPILDGMEAYERSQMCDALQTETYEKGSQFVTQGADGDKFFILEEGECTCLKVYAEGTAPQEVMQYKPGDYFGELALLTNDKRAASIIAKTDVKCLTLSRKVFKSLLGSLEEMLKRNSSKYT